MAQHGYSVRVSDIRDLTSVTDLLRASYPVLMRSAYHSAMLGPALELMTRANPKLLASGTYYVAESADGAIVGCGGWTREAPGQDTVAEGVGHVRHFGTHPDWARQGIGRAIFRRCERDAAACGIHELECYSSLNAERFYSALGFERIAVIDVRLNADVSLTGCHMRYRL